MKTKVLDRIQEIKKNLNLNSLSIKIDGSNLGELGIDLANDLSALISDISSSHALKWCLSTIKKSKVFLKIYWANEKGKTIYKEEIAKQLPEYSYKTIATIVDEGIEKGFYIELDPHGKKVSDKKIKNIRPSLQVITDFYNWNIARVSRIEKIIQKYKSSI